MKSGGKGLGETYKIKQQQPSHYPHTLIHKIGNTNKNTNPNIFKEKSIFTH